MKKKIKCPEIDMSRVSNECDCSYTPPAIKKVELRKGADGNLEVRLNGEGAWYPAELDGTTLRFYA